MNWKWENHFKPLEPPDSFHVVASDGWLEKAIDMAGKKDIRLMALDDLDLKPLWPQISEI